MKILITGAKGFIGQSLSKSLRGFDVIEAERDDWSSHLAGVNCVIHLAARVHIAERSQNSIAYYRLVNVAQTLEFAKNCNLAGVKRFIFISSIKVNGDFTKAGRKYTPDDSPNPQSPYGISKWEAEKGLRKIAKFGNMELVIIRPPLVYGPGVKANFLSMMNYLQKGLPLPLGGIENKRSLVFIDNLIDLIIKLIDHPSAPGQIFLVSDDEDVSTSRLLIDVGRALGKPAKLINFPQNLLNFFFKATGKNELRDRLFGSLQVDIKKTKTLLNWSPPFKFSDGVKKTVQAYLADK